MLIYCAVCGASGEFVQVGKTGRLLLGHDFVTKCEVVKERIARGEDVGDMDCPNMNEAQRRATKR